MKPRAPFDVFTHEDGHGSGLVWRPKQVANYGCDIGVAASEPLFDS